MIKDLYKTENMCFCQSIFIQLVHVFNPMFVNETNWLREDLLKKERMRIFILMYIIIHKLLIKIFVLLNSSCFFHSESSMSFILCYTSARFVRLCRIYRICDTCFCCLCPCITTCFWYLILWSLKNAKKKIKIEKDIILCFYWVSTVR